MKASSNITHALAAIVLVEGGGRSGARVSCRASRVLCGAVALLALYGGGGTGGTSERFLLLVHCWRHVSAIGAGCVCICVRGKA